MELRVSVHLSYLPSCSPYIKEFLGSENTLGDILIVAICDCVFVQYHRMYNIKTEPNVNHVVCVIVMCWCVGLYLQQVFPLWWDISILWEVIHV
jgi:hypothetical protein